MPSFKRREPASNQQKLANGLRPAPYPSPVPLFSTGLASLDDVLSGSGLPSSSVLAICPALGLATLSTHEEEQERTLQKSSAASGSDQTLDALKAAEEVALDLMSYSVAQSLVASQETLVIGKGARKLIRDRMPGKATSRDYSQSVDKKKEAEEDALTIAFRYAHRPKFKTTVDEPEVSSDATLGVPEEHFFRAPFDKSKRWSEEEIVAAEERKRGKLRCIEESTYEATWRAIEQEGERCKHLSLDKTRPLPTLRLHLPQIGSLGMMRDGKQSLETRLMQLSRFLLRLRRFLKDLSLHDETPIHSISLLTLSSDLLLPFASINRTTLHISRFVDAQVLISDFTHYPHLRKAYLGYGGAVSLLKGPSVGFLLPPGESRSVLRGGVAEAGAENDVGWKKKRRGIVLETLHEDVDSGVKEKDDPAAKDASQGKKGDDIEEAALGLSRKKVEARPSAHTHFEPSPAPAPRPTKVKFEGLKSLRERGMRATKQVIVQVDETDEW
ncbi:hypothetical protein CBS101457_000387 [Exobasidium rhododendri]|nr:hypothetical protein CBS101457_000387 [Exobasidium rhododendri]